jgi:hypothetical protein
MKILFLSQGYQVEDHPGWNDALEKLKEENEIEDFLNIPYFNYAEKYGWEAFYNEVINLCKNQNFDVVYFHHFHKKGKPSPKRCLETLSNLSKRPIIVTSCGDGLSDNWMRPDYPEDFKEASKFSDITFSTQMGKAADKMLEWGAKNIVLSPLGICQRRFKVLNINYDKHSFDFNLVFLGSNNSSRLFNPISHHWWGAKKRQKLVKLLSKKLGDSFGLFGKNWNYKSCQGFVNFDSQQKTFQKGKISIDAPPYSTSDYYMSNRPLFQITSSVPTILYNVPRLNKILRSEDHCYFVNDHNEAYQKYAELINGNYEMLLEKAKSAANYVYEKHTQYQRMKFHVDTIKRYKLNNYRLDVEFPFFLPEVDLESEKKFAIRTNK